MTPQEEQFEAQERLRRMKLVADYLQTTTASDDPLRISFMNYLVGYANIAGAGQASNPIDSILLPIQTHAPVSPSTTH